MRQILAFLLVLLLPALSNAETYHMTTTGSDVASGLEVAPWRTLAASDSKLSCGDTLLIHAGTYTETAQVNFSQTCAAGNEITISNYADDAPTIQWSSRTDSTISGFNFLNNSAGFIIKGLDLYNGWTIKIDHSDRITFRRNKIHHMAESGITTGGASIGGGCVNCVIEYNAIYDNGDYTIPQCGNNPLCSQFHGLYISGSWTIRYNLIYDNLGFGLQAHGVSGANTAYMKYSGTVAHNVFAYTRNRSGITLWNENSAAMVVTVQNNLFYENSQNFPNYANGIRDQQGNITGTVIKNNVGYATGNSTNFLLGTFSGVTISGNCPSSNPTTTSCATAPSLVNAPATLPGSPDFRLTSSSTILINQGLALSGYAFNGSAPDIGAYESFGFSSASIDVNVMDVTLGMSLNTPAIPASAVTGFTVNCTGTGCGTPVVASAARKSGTDSVIRLTISGITGDACDASQAWTVTYTPGNVTDSIAIPTGSGQTLSAFTTQGVTEVCSGSGTPAPGTPYIQYEFEDGSGTNVNDSSANNLDGTFTNSPEWGTGHTGGGVTLTASSTDYVAVPYGSGVNPTTQSLTIAFGVLVAAGQEASPYVYFGSTLGTNQRLYVSTHNSTWTLGIQASNDTQDGSIAVTSGWHRVCLNVNSGTDVATLYIDGTASTAGGAKAYTSYTFASNFRIGSSFDSSPGATYDEFKVWQSVEDCATDFASWEQVAPDPTGTYTQVTHQWQLLRTPATSHGTAGATVAVVVGGAVALVTQIDCTLANCDPTGVRLYYSKSGGAFLQVPDVCASDGVCFYGTPDADVLSGTVECCLSGALTENDGPTNTTAAAIPLFDLAQDGSFVRRSILKFGSSVSAGDTFCFKEYHQTDLELNGGYTPSGGACVTIVGVSMGVGF